MSVFESLIQTAQENELRELAKVHEEERKQAEQLRLQHYPGTISGRDLVSKRQDLETKINEQLDEIEAASRKAEKDAENAAQESAGSFPPPPITVGG
jgi:hypothetical protein